jgi:hypothetical protein
MNEQKQMYTIYYELKNRQGCFEWYKEKEKATKKFDFYKGNSNYRMAELFDTNGKSVFKFER